MAFLDRFSDDHRALFESAAARIELARGEYLIRRGEPGGDIYLLKEGGLEVVDSRSTPEVILAALQPGVVVGEMAFVDDSPRSADVRAAEVCTVLRWQRDDLRGLLKREVEFASAFYEALARFAAERVRTVTSNAMAGGLSGRKPVNRAGLARVQEETRRVAELVKDALVDIETRLRLDSTDKVAQAQVFTLLDHLEAEIETLFVAHPTGEAAAEAARVLGRELNPYLVRSSLAERCIRRPQGVVGTAEILAHVLVNNAGGDGQVGELIDRWLLDRPTLRALREYREVFCNLAAANVPRHRNRRVMLVNAGTGSLVAGLIRALSDSPTILTVVDQSRDALSYLDAGLSSPSVALEAVQESFVQLALGRARATFPPQDAVVIHGMLEYLPDRLCVGVLSACRSLLAKDGVVLASALGPSSDRDILDRLLTWPTIRRTPEHLRRLFEAADLDVAEEGAVPPPGLLFAGRPGAVATV